MSENKQTGLTTKNDTLSAEQQKYFAQYGRVFSNEHISLLKVEMIQLAYEVANRREKGAKMNAAQKTVFESGLWYLTVRAYSYQYIADLMGHTRQNIGKTIKRMVNDTLGSMYAEIEYERRIHYQMIMNIYHECMKSWELSKRPKKRVTSKQYMLPKDLTEKKRKAIEEEMNLINVSQVTTVAHGRPEGDPRYLSQALKALSDAQKLMAMHAHVEDELDWHNELTRIGMNADEIYSITVFKMQKKLKDNANLDGGGAYDMLADPNVKNIIDVQAKDVIGDNGSSEDE